MMRCPDMLARYTQPLVGVSSPGLETTDEKLLAVVGAMEKHLWEAAGELLAGLDASGVYDVRLFPFSCYLAWREAGFAALPWIWEATLLTLGANLKSFGPERKKDAHLDVRLGWAFSTIVDDIVYHEKVDTPEWAAWTKTVSDEVIERMKTARAAMLLVVTDERTPRAIEAFRRLTLKSDPIINTFLAAGKAERARVAEVAAKAVAEKAVDEAFVEDTRATSQREDAMMVEPRSRAEVKSGSNRVEVVVSPAFFELQLKLRAFEKLVAKSKFQKAALVADDLTGLVSNFDPRTYFPDLFAQFGKDLAENIDALASHWEERDSLAWKALEQYYRVDLQRFVDG